MCKLDVIIDMGSANTVIVERKAGLVLSEPSLLAAKKIGGKLKAVAVGAEAKKMWLSKKKPEDVSFIYPISGGVVVNTEAAALMLKHFLERITHRMLIRPQFEVLCLVSCGLRTAERKGFEDVFYRLGIKSVSLVEAPLAAAADVAAGCKFVVIMGEGTTDIAIVNASGIVAGCSIDVSGAKMDEAIRNHIFYEYNLTISKARAEDLRIRCGTLSEREVNVVTVSGKDVVDGRRKKMELSSKDVRVAITPIINVLCEAILSISNVTPDYLVDAVKHGGIQMYGGASGLHYLRNYIGEQLGVEAEIHADVTALAMGAASFFEDKPKLYRMMGINLGGRV